MKMKTVAYMVKIVTFLVRIICEISNSSNRADREKDKSNYRFPSIVKNNSKEGLKHSKVRREKWLAQIFRKDLTERKLQLC